MAWLKLTRVSSKVIFVNMDRVLRFEAAEIDDGLGKKIACTTLIIGTHIEDKISVFEAPDLIAERLGRQLLD